MRTIDSDTTAAWQSQIHGGATQPMMRATITALHIASWRYNLAHVKGSLRKGTGLVTSQVFAQKVQPVELPNIRSIKWQRSVDTDTATCTITLFNVEPLPIGDTPLESDGFDRPGFFTYNRGKTTEGQSRWGHTPNDWANWIMPDRIIRTYEGYGFDPNLSPEDDPSMYPSGVWRIDDVDYDADNNIVITCRDLASALVDQICFPPVVPWKQYPLSWSRFEKVKNKTTYKEGGSGWHRPTYDTDSNYPYGAQYGHFGKYAFDKSPKTYWMSVGNDSPRARYAFEYVQGKFSSRTVAAVKVTAWGGPYEVYISLYNGTKWLGKHKIPYHQDGVGRTNANEKFVHIGHVGKGDTTVIKLGKAYHNITKVRVTFHHLYNSGIGTYKYRAGCHNVEVSSTVKTVNPTTYHVEGDYQDYTDIVKWFCAWGGFFWPKTGATFVQSDGTTATLNPSTSDPIFPDHLGRVWGDFQASGTNGPASLTVDRFDKKPLMDGISYVRDILGFIFFIDESGGVIWRMPNIWSIGNWISNPSGGAHTSRTSTVVEIDEKTTLRGLQPKLSNKNVREAIFVGNTNGKFGATRPGFNPNPSGLRRVGGWTDQHFASKAESVRMADLITLRQAFEYRVETVKISGYPGIQIDDQVRIYERVTADTYYHYVRGITSEWNAMDRDWVYTLDTHWLGEVPLTHSWAFNKDTFDKLTIAYLKTVGAI